MKKLFVSLFVFVFALGLVACENTGSTECTSHIDEDLNGLCDECGKEVEVKVECTEHIDENKDGSCDKCGEKVEVKEECTEHIDENKDGSCDKCGEKVEVKEESIKDQFDCITIAEAIELANKAGQSGTSEKYYVYGIVKEVKNAMYGEMTIEDETGSIYVYGVYSADETTRYDAMEDKPVVGDEVVLLAMLKTYNGNPELDRGYLQAFKHIEKELDLSEYPSEVMPIEEVRNLEAGKKVRISGVVAQITYAFGMNPNGVYVVDGTNSIYVYGKEVATAVKVGNKVTLVGEKTYYVLDNEKASANKYGYMGCCQVQNPILVENDKATNEIDLSWVEEVTIKDIMDTSCTENITTSIYKVTSLVRKSDSGSFVNYYFNDLDGFTGSYTYTSCSGEDFAWLDEFDGKICTVYLSVINAKSTSSGCIWRFLPIKVVDEGFTFDQNKGADFVLKYYALGQFLREYESDPEVELITSVSNDVIDIFDAKVSYASSNEEVVYFGEVDGKLILHTGEVGTVTVTITVSYKGVQAVSEVEINVKEPVVYETISVLDAIKSDDGTEVILKGIVASSLVNQSGFYLIDETGVIAVVASEDQVSELSAGDEVVVKGTKTHRIKEGYLGAGQINIDDATILANYYGNHEYSTSTFDSSKTLNELYELDHNEDHSTEVYVVKAVVKVVTTYYYSSIKIESLDGKVQMSLYCSSANQYEFLKQYADKEVTLELAMCNWNGKDYYAGCVISVTYEGVKTVNTLNFK